MPTDLTHLNRRTQPVSRCSSRTSQRHQPLCNYWAKSFLYEVGRTNAILQTDDETSIKALTKELARQISGLTVRVAPTGSKESQGSVERYHQTLHAQIRTLRLALAANYNLDIVELQSSHPIITWATRRAAWLLNRYLIHSRRRTHLLPKAL